MAKGRSHEERSEEQRGFTPAEQAALRERAEAIEAQRKKKAAKSAKFFKGKDKK